MTKPSQTRSEAPADGLIEIFRAGRHTDMHGRSIEFTAADLQAIAEGYDPTLSQAPVVVGHSTTSTPLATSPPFAQLADRWKRQGRLVGEAVVATSADNSFEDAWGNDVTAQRAHRRQSHHPATLESP